MKRFALFCKSILLLPPVATIITLLVESVNPTFVAIFPKIILSFPVVILAPELHPK
jgi:hypothetical protein